MFDKMKQMMEIKKQADRIKRELESTSVEVEEVTGLKIIVTGAQQFRSVEISESHLEPANKKRFEADLLQSLNAAMQKSQAVAAEKMKNAMPGLPGL